MEEQDKLEAWIDGIIAIDGLRGPDAVDAKLDVLSYLVDSLKRGRKAKGPTYSFEQYVHARHDVIDNVLFLVPSNVRQELGKGFSPVQLQVPLLLFLLIHHRDRHNVLDIIDLFTGQLAGQFMDVDYKRTDTGVIRCYTNTRFAAKSLRDYGLLRYTHKEAYKTWELSLIGLVAASVVFHERAGNDEPWQIPSKALNTVSGISQEVLTALQEVHDYRAFVERLSRICIPHTDLFGTFGPALERAFKLLQGYVEELGSKDLKEADRRKLGPRFIKQLEQEGIDDKFHEEFSQCMQLDELVRGKY
ncbi:MAG TPA: hypothetical protein PLY76_13145 [Flavobacteriales bacterium]|nr:hypothetical protein [Flavobacteriales bacterium]HRP82836.1 hypothetical protein [Flavobacteriales bacterium]